MSRTMRVASVSPLYVDLSKPLKFTFAGQEYTAYAGDTLASALLANGLNIFSRSFKYHRPRGPLTLSGNDANTLVQALGRKSRKMKGEPNMLADKILLEDGDIFDGQNYSGSLDTDKGRFIERFSRFLPVGFYYKTFYKPVLGFFDRKKTDSWPLWEPIIRSQAGLGKLDLSAIEKRSNKYYMHTDVAVVGAGMSGLSVALNCADSGLQVTLIEADIGLGGAMQWSAAFKLFGKFGGVYVDDDKNPKICRIELINKVEAHPNIKVLKRSTCTGVFEDNYLSIIDDSEEPSLLKLRAKHCVLATGELEQHIVFRNNDLPGVMLCSAADRMLSLYGVAPGAAIVILTCSDEAYYSALYYAELGLNVSTLVDLRSAPDDVSLLTLLEHKQINVLFESTVFEAKAEKNKRLSSVEVRKISAKGEVHGEGILFSCDTLCVNGGYIPTYQLPCQAGATLNFDESKEALSLLNLPENLYLSGAASGYINASDVLSDAELKTVEICRKQGIDTTQFEPKPQSVEPIIRRVNNWTIFKHPKGKEFVDFDEDLHIRDIENATRLGYRDIQLVKRFSTLGMGPSQGKHSAIPAAYIVAQATGRSISETGVTTARPPLVGEKLSLLAGQCFDPYKRSAMHQRHIELGAQMMPAGQWQRPAYYGERQLRAELINEEVVHVRNSVGIIDVSTLGGLDIRGPDAAEFLSRFYTFAFVKQKIGTTRYAIATNENGVVIDDGVACRINENYFYVTATTSGVDALYRAMTKWNAQWRLDVDIVNVTSAYAAVNVAGPDSRRFLQTLSSDIALSAEAFPYLAYREGSIEGIPVRMMRVGFVGELGYELHVPSGFGLALWDLLTENGRNFNLRPVGIEAQRVLRLEKGHIIVGQDSDGMSHPAELGFNWAVSKKKPFFVGCKSVDIYQRKALKRKLVGFSVKGQLTAPKEGQLVFANEVEAKTKASKVKGFVTSCAYSPTLGLTIGLAFIDIEVSHQSNFVIKIGKSEVLEVEFSSTPFYDSENQRNADHKA